MKILIIICASLVFIFSLILVLFPIIDKEIYERKRKLYLFTKKIGLDNKYYLFSRVSSLILLISSIFLLVISILLM